MLGAYLEGDHSDDWRDGPWLTVPQGVAHIVALGATGAGKTVSILRLIAAHLEAGWRVIVIDGKEEADTREEFLGLALDAGVQPDRLATWPSDGPLDLFRGEAPAIKDRWIACETWSEAYYRAVAGALLTLVCEDPDGPPASTTEFLERLEPKYLSARWAGTPAGQVATQLTPSEVNGTALRYFSRFSDLLACGAVPTPGEPSWSWEDTDACWVTLPTATRPDTAGALGRVVLLDLMSYLRDEQRRPERKPLLLVIEEMGALVSADPATALAVIEGVERARSAEVRCLLSAQTPEGLGDATAQARLLHGGPAILAHRMANPEPVVATLGTTYGFEASIGVDALGSLGDFGSLREQHQWRLPPNVLRQLPPGQAAMVWAGQWATVAVARTRKPTRHRQTQGKPVAELTTPAGGTDKPHPTEPDWTADPWQ